MFFVGIEWQRVIFKLDLMVSVFRGKVGDDDDERGEVAGT